MKGALILRIDSTQHMDVVRRSLLGSDASIESVERVPIRMLTQMVPAEAVEPVAPWHLPRIRLDRARNRTGFNDGSGASVAVLDTGIDADHPLLQPAIDHYSYAPPEPGLTSGRRDIIGHGTHVAGTIAAQGAPGDVEGVSRARLHIHKIFGDDIAGLRYFQQADGSLIVLEDRFVHPVMYRRALAAGIDNSMDVVNLSIGGRAIGDSREQALFRLLAGQEQIVIAAMGNDRREGSPTSWPAAYPSVIAVGALDLNDGVAPFSNGGSHICISAPGVDILATMPTYRGVQQWTGRRDPGGAILRDKPLHWTVYRSTMRGTSMAAPQVAGAAALWVEKNARNIANFRQSLQQSARKLSSMGSAAFHEDYGYGCLDLDALLP